MRTLDVTVQAVGAAGWEELISARLIAGDAGALSEVYAQFGAYVYGLARRVIRDVDRAEDVAQEVFCQLWERPERFRPERGSMRAFLGVLTHRRAVDHVRRSESSRRRDADYESSVALPPDITEAVHAGLDAERVREAVRALPEEQRTPVLLAYFGGRTFREVAEILQIPEGTAKSRIRVALNKLARALDTRMTVT